jgi:hypothetical protein
MTRSLIALLVLVPVVALSWLAVGLTHYNRVVIDVVNHPERYEWRLDWPKGVEWELCDERCMARLAALPEPTSVECGPGWIDDPCCIVTFGGAQPSTFARLAIRFVPFYGISLEPRPAGSHEVHLHREADGYRITLFSGVTNRPPKRQSDTLPATVTTP